MGQTIDKSEANYRTELEKNGVIAFVPGGNSMWPTLKHRGQSVIVVKKTNKLKHFDVALYQRDCGTFVLHRVMEPTDFGYVICGDSQFALEKVREDQVFGVMQGFYRGKKYIEVSDPDYIAEVEKWYSNPKKRKRVLKRFFFWQAVKYKIKRAFSIIFRKGK